MSYQTLRTGYLFSWTVNLLSNIQLLSSFEGDLADILGAFDSSTCNLDTGYGSASDDVLQNATRSQRISDVLGWASSPEPAEPSPFKPEPGRALMRACNGLGLGSPKGEQSCLLLNLLGGFLCSTKPTRMVASLRRLLHQI